MMNRFLGMGFCGGLLISATLGVGVAAGQETDAGVKKAQGDIKVVTYNIENWRTAFLAHKLRDQKLLEDEEANRELLTTLREANDEDNWETAKVLKELDADIVMFQEGCSKEDLEFFNKRWLDGKYETLVVFPTNSGRGQTLGMMMKKGFRIVETKDQYHQEPDTVENPRGEKLFARGPAFVLIEDVEGAGMGYKFWLGNTHQKSKSGNSVDVTAWRNREAVRTYQIMQELRKAGPADVMLVGDFNDEYGVQEYEAEGGGDTIQNNIAPAGTEAGNELVLATKPLVEANERSFGGYFRDRGGFIDHVVVTPEMAGRVKKVGVVRNDLTRLASDHFPVYAIISTEKTE